MTRSLLPAASRTPRRGSRVGLLAALLLSTGSAVSCTPDREIDSGSRPAEAAERAPEAGLPTPPASAAPDPEDPRIGELEALIGSGAFEAAGELAEAVLADHPDHGHAELLLALSLHKRKLYLRARPHFLAVLARGPSFELFDATWYYLGWCLFNTGELELAREAFERHLETNPDEGDTHFGLGVVALEQGREDDALASLQRSIELNLARVESGDPSRMPDVAKGWARVADVWLAREDPTKAREALERCVQVWPPHFNAWYKLYQVHTELGNEELAARSLEAHEHWKAQARGADAAPTDDTSAEE